MDTAAALPIVNWIFWGALAGGTALAVGLTEWWGGTTSGYRLFMAWVIGAGAVIWLASELRVSPGLPDDPSADLRRVGVWIFAGLTLAYLVASHADWPRMALVIGAGLLGIGLLVVMALGGGTDSPPLLAAVLVATALALGAVNAAMLLGHWYLVTPKLSPAPLRRLIWLLVGALAAQGLLVGWSVMMGSGPLLDSGVAWLTGLRVAVGIVLPLAIAVLALLATGSVSLQATTGLLYIGLAMIMAGTIGAAALSYLSGSPV